jgi:predicted metal-dependent hydrolase
VSRFRPFKPLDDDFFTAAFCSMTQLALDFCGWRVIERVSQRARCIRIEIRGDDEVLLVIPRWASRAAAHRFLDSRKDWIRRTLSRQRLRKSRPVAGLVAPVVSVKELRDQARRTATSLIAEEAARMGVRPKGLRIADQKTLWGSCGASGRISLSWRLVLAPANVFRYVVVHELAHLVHANHSPRFWSLVERQMPDFQSARSWLRDHGSALHAVAA